MNITTAGAAHLRAEIRSKALLAYLVLICALFVLSAPLSQIHPQLGALRSWQIVLHPVALLALAWGTRFEGIRDLVLPRWGWPAVLTCSLVWLLAFQFGKYFAFQAHGLDFSIFDGMLYSAGQGAGFYAPVVGLHHLGVHPTYVLLPLAALHRLWGSPLLLTGVTAVVVWAALFPLVRLVKRSLASDALALFAVVAFLTNPFTAALVDGGFRPEVFYPWVGLWLVVGWTEERPRLWVPVLLAFLSIKEDAAFHASALAVGTALFEGRRWRSCLAVVAVSLAVFAANVAIVQPHFLAKSGHYTPGYLGFWGHLGSTLPEIVSTMVRRPWVVIADILSSRWWAVLLPALMLPLLGRASLFALVPTIVLLGSTHYAQMRGFRNYYPVTMLPFLFWALCEADSRLSRLRLPVGARDGLLVSALLLFPLFHDGYLTLRAVQPAIHDAARAAGPTLATLSDPPCIQSSLYPHLPYRAQVGRVLGDKRCLAGANWALVHPSVDTWPFKRTLVEELVRRAHAEARGRDLGAGLVLVEPGLVREVLAAQ